VSGFSCHRCGVDHPDSNDSSTIKTAPEGADNTPREPDQSNLQGGSEWL